MYRNKKIQDDVCHVVPDDMKMIFIDQHLLSLWNNLTPLARNEWICWVISVSKQTTREKHIQRAVESILSGKKRPCCWWGCQHREK